MFGLLDLFVMEAEKRRGSAVADGAGVSGKGLHELTIYRSRFCVGAC